MSTNVVPVIEPALPPAGAGGHPVVVLNLLGRFQVLVDGHQIRLPDTVQRLLVFLALHDRPQPRLVVSGNLWPEKPDGRASANLRSALWRARVPDGPALVTADASSLALSKVVATDWRTMEATGWSLVERRPEEPLSRSVRDRFLEELLPGWYDDWVIMERERLGQLRLHFLESFIDALLREARYAEALDTALRLVAVDPERERSQATLGRVYEAEGSLARARRCRLAPALSGVD